MAKKFSKPEVDAKFDIVTDEPVHINCKGYNGALENAPLAIVEGLVSRKNPHVKAKVVVAAKADKVADAAKQ